MIAIDTNILVRYLVGDDERETALARALREDTLTPDEPGFLTTVTACEILWVIKRQYGFGRAAQASVLELTLASPQLVLEHTDAIRAALDSEHPDIADAVIHQVGQANGCARTLTLDKKFARLAGVSLLA